MSMAESDYSFQYYVIVPQIKVSAPATSKLKLFYSSYVNRVIIIVNNWSALPLNGSNECQCTVKVFLSKDSFKLKET